MVLQIAPHVDQALTGQKQRSSLMRLDGFRMGSLELTDAHQFGETTGVVTIRLVEAHRQSAVCVTRLHIHPGETLRLELSAKPTARTTCLYSDAFGIGGMLHDIAAYRQRVGANLTLLDELPASSMTHTLVSATETSKPTNSIGDPPLDKGTSHWPTQIFGDPAFTPCYLASLVQTLRNRLAAISHALASMFKDIPNGWFWFGLGIVQIQCG
ncbi:MULTISPECIES: hypothetical protein [unclassified Sphingobium]|uniref:hypothetical protein n=1 Tax=unclassified Sphingobium TaxID=2611147 RepID=UPI0019113DF6|nr:MULTISPECIES: hypothetical protein [unclassified Sphingobium]